MDIIDAFNQYSKDYDQNRRTFIPCFDEFYHSITSVLSFKTKSPSILDLGAGTGLASSFVLSKYPDAKITLIDQAEEMLQLASERFAENANIHYIVGDYSTFSFTEKYDAIISALSIHHLENDAKEKLYQRCFSLLTSNGIFVNADQVLSPFPSIENQLISLWHEFIQTHDLTAEEFEAYHARTAFDQTAPLNDQMLWLLDAGFSQADCIFKYLNFAVFFAQK